MPADNALLMTIASGIGANDHPDTWFYLSGRRSAEFVSACWDTIVNLEKPMDRPVDRSPTQTLAKSGYLPFADVFP